MQPWPSDFKGSPENNHGETPLHSAAISGHLEKSQMENMKPENNHGQTPLHSAATSGTFEFNFVNASRIKSYGLFTFIRLKR